METVAAEQPPKPEVAQAQPPTKGAEAKPVTRKQRTFQSRPLFDTTEKPSAEAIIVKPPPAEIVLNPDLEESDLKIEMSVRVVGRKQEVMRANFNTIAHAVTRPNQGIFLTTVQHLLTEVKHAVNVKVTEHLKPVEEKPEAETDELSAESLPEFKGEALIMHTPPKVDVSVVKPNGSEPV